MSTEQSLENNPPATPAIAGEIIYRHLSLWNSLTHGFAMVSPVAGLYAIMGVQTAVTGGGWFIALALCLIMQLLVATVYAELASQFPIAGGAYKWAHHGRPLCLPCYGPESDSC